jgi:hypothetical protein
MSANIGVALSLVTQPDSYTDPGLSERVRGAVQDSLLFPADDRPALAGGAPLPGAALQLAALLRIEPSELGHEETRLMLKWLDELAKSDQASVSRAPSTPASVHSRP